MHDAGTGLSATAADAALANGVMAHADETDDSHNASRSHTGCAVVPAALAVGEEIGVDGARFIRAVTLGYDVGTRVVIAMGGFAFRSDTSLRDCDPCCSVADRESEHMKAVGCAVAQTPAVMEPKLGTRWKKRPSLTFRRAFRTHQGVFSCR